MHGSFSEGGGVNSLGGAVRCKQLINCQSCVGRGGGRLQVAFGTTRPIAQSSPTFKNADFKEKFLRQSRKLNRRMYVKFQRPYGQLSYDRHP